MWPIGHDIEWPLGHDVTLLIVYDLYGVIEIGMIVLWLLGHDTIYRGSLIEMGMIVCQSFDH